MREVGNYQPPESRDDETPILSLVHDFRESSDKSIILCDACGGIDAGVCEALQHMVAKGETRRGDAVHIKRLGDVLQRFTRDMHAHADMPAEDLRELSVLVKIMKEFFMRGRFAEFTTAKDHTVAATWAYMVNQLAKIKQTRRDDREGYMGPGQQIEPFNLGDPEVQELFRRVSDFEDSFLTHKMLGKQMGSTGHKHWRAEQSRRELLYAQLREQSRRSHDRMTHLEQKVWPGRGAEGLYYVKHGITVADYLSRGHTLADMMSAIGKDEIVQRMQAEGSDITVSNAAFAYDFERGEFGVEKKGKPIPRSEAGRSKGDRMVHYDPDAMMFMGLVVEYFRHHRELLVS